MTRLALALALLAALPACKSARDEDCATVRALLDRHTVPRRSYDDGPDSHVVITALDAPRALQAHTYQDPEIAAAVKAVGDTTWTVYTPYSTDHDSAIDKLAGLCGMPRRRVVSQ